MADDKSILQYYTDASATDIEHISLQYHTLPLTLFQSLTGRTTTSQNWTHWHDGTLQPYHVNRLRQHRLRRTSQHMAAAALPVCIRHWFQVGVCLNASARQIQVPQRLETSRSAINVHLASFLHFSSSASTLTDNVLPSHRRATNEELKAHLLSAILSNI